MKKKTDIVAVSIPPVSREFVTYVKQTFRPRPIKDEDTLIAIGRQAGRQEVVDFIERFAQGGTQITGDPKALETQQNLNFFQDMFKGKHNG